MSPDSLSLSRYLDGEMDAAETARFRRRLTHSARLRRELSDMQRVGHLLRYWARSAERGAGGLGEATLSRWHAERGRAFRGALAPGLLGLVLLALSASPAAPQPQQSTLALAPSALGNASVDGATVERIEAADQAAQIFRVGRASTPVVWLVDDDVDQGAL